MGYRLWKEHRHCIAAVTELWTIFDGLKLLWSKGANHVLLESDSKVVVHACTSEDDSYGNYALTSCIKEIQHRNWTVHVTHIYREPKIATHALTFLQDPSVTAAVRSSPVTLGARIVGSYSSNDCARYFVRH
ncbi:hypothetical protein Golob_002745 [Gossypium lobatum]|uniref:RNase H type-1 domain-containing protein n=1 Tax=Gossypium lobatum TaxID=34289 RepID=A0A7J8N603_9ROSI|nr:hypothetical protein [Gossypium lobatum]